MKNSLKLTAIAGLLASADSFNNNGRSINNNGRSLSFSREKAKNADNKCLHAKISNADTEQDFDNDQFDKEKDKLQEFNQKAFQELRELNEELLDNYSPKSDIDKEFVDFLKDRKKTKDVPKDYKGALEVDIDTAVSAEDQVKYLNKEFRTQTNTRDISRFEEEDSNNGVSVETDDKIFEQLYNKKSDIQNPNRRKHHLTMTRDFDAEKNRREVLLAKFNAEVHSGLSQYIETEKKYGNRGIEFRCNLQWEKSDDSLRDELKRRIKELESPEPTVNINANFGSFLGNYANSPTNEKSNSNQADILYNYSRKNFLNTDRWKIEQILNIVKEVTDPTEKMEIARELLLVSNNIYKEVEASPYDDDSVPNNRVLKEKRCIPKEENQPLWDLQNVEYLKEALSIPDNPKENSLSSREVRVWYLWKVIQSDFIQLHNTENDRNWYLSKVMDKVKMLSESDDFINEVKKLDTSIKELKEEAIKITNKSQKKLAEFLYRDSSELNKPLDELIKELKKSGFEKPYEEAFKKMVYSQNRPDPVDTLFCLQIRKYN
jgi:hypothetical protein